MHMHIPAKLSAQERLQDGRIGREHTALGKGKTVKKTKKVETVHSQERGRKLQWKFYGRRGMLYIYVEDTDI